MIINKSAILAAMKKKNIKTQTELAERLGMNKSQLSQMLSDDFCPLKTNVIKMMSELDISYNQILFEKESDTMSLSNMIIEEPIEQLYLFPSTVIDRFAYRLDEFVNVEQVSPNKKYTLVETFAGAGGLSLGLEKSGLQSIAGIEIDATACATLRKNRPNWNVIETDITELVNTGIHKHDQFDFTGELDVLSGGYPCQSFSYAGLRHGLDDTRGTLFYPVKGGLKL